MTSLTFSLKQTNSNTWKDNESLYSLLYESLAINIMYCSIEIDTRISMKEQRKLKS